MSFMTSVENAPLDDKDIGFLIWMDTDGTPSWTCMGAVPTSSWTPEYYPVPKDMAPKPSNCHCVAATAMGIEPKTAYRFWELCAILDSLERDCDERFVQETVNNHKKHGIMINEAIQAFIASHTK